EVVLAEARRVDGEHVRVHVQGRLPAERGQPRRAPADDAQVDEDAVAHDHAHRTGDAEAHEVDWAVLVRRAVADLRAHGNRAETGDLRALLHHGGRVDRDRAALEATEQGASRQ